VLRKLAHIGAYAVLTVLLWWALQMYTSSKVRAWLLAALAAALMESPTNGISPGLPGVMALSAI
jgi:hypothetical protein